MEQSTLLKIARLRTLSARNGKAFDVVRFATDRQFARDTLTTVLDTDDEQVLMLGLELMDALKMVTLDASPVPVAAPLPATPPAPSPTDTTAMRYIGRLR